MGLKRLRRTRHADPKEEHGTHPVQETATAEAPHHVMDTSLYNNVVQLQSLIGNHRVQRLLSEGHINRKTGLIQMQPDTPVAAPVLTPTAPTAVENQPAPGSEPGEIEIEQGMYQSAAQESVLRQPSAKTGLAVYRRIEGPVERGPV
jgi:hypothetical protein